MSDKGKRSWSDAFVLAVIVVFVLIALSKVKGH